MADNLFKRILVSLLITIGGWAIFTLIRLLIEAILIDIGITNELTQMSIIVVVVILSLSLLGYGFRKSLKKLF